MFVFFSSWNPPNQVTPPIAQLVLLENPWWVRVHKGSYCLDLWCGSYWIFNHFSFIKKQNQNLNLKGNWSELSPKHKSRKNLSHNIHICHNVSLLWFFTPKKKTIQCNRHWNLITWPWKVEYQWVGFKFTLVKCHLIIKNKKPIDYMN